MVFKILGFRVEGSTGARIGQIHPNGDPGVFWDAAAAVGSGLAGQD
jgi:hypothetical protein